MKNAYKIVTMGAAGIGKTSIMHRFVYDNYTDYPVSTIGAAFLAKMLKLSDGSLLRLDLWDMAGNERFENIAPIYYRGADGCIVVYDITDMGSYERAKYWVERLLNENNSTKTRIIALVGNKTDLQDQRTIKKEEAIQYAKSKSILYFEVSAKTGFGVDELFKSVTKAIAKDPEKPEDETSTIINLIDSSNKENTAYKSGALDNRLINRITKRCNII
jgi:Ras-related protein Rab-5C